MGALIGMRAAQTRGFSVARGVISGVLLGPLAFLMYFVAAEGRKCPACAEWVKPEARVCKHCGAQLVPWIPERSEGPNWIMVWTVVLFVLAIAIFVARIALEI